MVQGGMEPVDSGFMRIHVQEPEPEMTAVGGLVYIYRYRRNGA
jgi:hypothetical protein